MTTAFSTFRFSPVALDAYDFPEGADEALGTLVEQFDMTEGKRTYWIAAGDQLETYPGEGSYNSCQNRSMHLVVVRGLKNHDRFGDRGSFRKATRAQIARLSSSAE